MIEAIGRDALYWAAIGGGVAGLALMLAWVEAVRRWVVRTDRHNRRLEVALAEAERHIESVSRTQSIHASSLRMLEGGLERHRMEPHGPQGGQLKSIPMGGRP